MMERKKKRERRGEGQIGRNDAEEERCSICASLEVEPFKIRYLKHPSFTCHSSYGQKGGNRVIEITRLRAKEKTLKDSTSKKGS